MVAAVVVFSTAWAGIEMTSQFGRVAAIWVANAILLAVLLRSPADHWAGYVSDGFAGNIIADLTTGDHLPTALALSLCNTVEILIAAIIVRRFWGSNPDLTKIRALGGFMAVAGVLAPAVSGAMSSLALWALKDISPWETWRIWFISDGLGMVLITLLLLTVRALEMAAMLRPSALLRTSAVLGGVVLAVGLVFYQSRYPILFLIFPPLMFAAFQLRFEGAAAAILLTGIIAIGMTTLGHGPLLLIAQATLVDQILLLQLILASACVTTLPVAAILGERKRLEEHARRAQRSAEQANRAKSDFLASLSHELRTPLNAIIGFSDLIEGQRLGPMGNPKYQEYARDIHTSGNHLLGMINELLDFAKIESGHLDLHEEVVELDTVLDFSIRMVAPRAQKNGVAIILTSDRKVASLRADERRLSQILLNILTNAVKFTPPGGRVTVNDAIGPGGEFMLVIADNGIGISEEDQGHILEPFRQAESSRKQEGTGLGLTITKRLVELHDGVLEIESRVGFGTKVVVRFPAERIHRLAEADALIPRTADFDVPGSLTR